MQVHARNTACEDSFFPKKRPVFRRPAEAPLAETADSCRPHQNEVFMRNERINASFFCIFDVFMQSLSAKFHVFDLHWEQIWGLKSIASIPLK